ncbi:PAS domain S-box protein [Methanolacinia petrolearia]|uniref:PAS domain S-box protein n=1 Tax=Methanolacinia petrolearia TaxID=54120 RepID=UPI003BACDFC1
MKFRGIVENSPDLIIRRYSEGVAVYVSPSSEKLLGYKPEELIGLHYSEILGPEETERVERHNSILYSGGKPGPIQLKIRKKDGSYADLESSAVFLNGRDASDGVQTISRDISFRREAENSIREKDELYVNLAENVPGMIYVIDEGGRLLYLNNSAASGLGKKKEEVLGKTLFEIFPEEQAEGHMKGVLGVLRSGEPFYREMIESLPTGDFWFSVSLLPLKDHDGISTGVLGVSYDITSRKTTEEALKRSEIQYAETLDAVTDAAFVVDRDLKFLLVNKAFRRLSGELGFEIPDDISGPGMRELLRFLPPAVFDEYGKFFPDGKTVSGEEEIVLPGGTVVVASTRIPVFSDKDVIRVVTVIHDIT